MASSKSHHAWTGFRSVMCPIDFSENSRLALRYAEAVASRTAGELTVFYANDPLLIAALAAARHDHSLTQQSAKELEQFVDSTLTARSQKRLRVTRLVTIGHAPDAILKAVVRKRADLLVVGSHGLTGPGRLLMGSTTRTLLQRSPIPVLAIPPRRGLTKAPAAWPGPRIVAAVDLGTDARREVENAARVARWWKSSLVLVHVVAAPSVPPWLKSRLRPLDRARTARARQAVDQLAETARRHVSTETRILCGSVPGEIVALATTERTGLMITALRDREGWLGSARGSISYDALSLAVAPVLACPPRFRVA